jgi:hypothetical protein
MVLLSALLGLRDSDTMTEDDNCRKTRQEEKN